MSERIVNTNSAADMRRMRVEIAGLAVL